MSLWYEDAARGEARAAATEADYYDRFADYSPDEEPDWEPDRDDYPEPIEPEEEWFA